MKVIGNILWAVLKRVRLFTDSTLGRADLALVRRATWNRLMVPMGPSYVAGRCRREPKKCRRR